MVGICDSSNESHIPTLEEFRKYKIWGKFTPLTAEDVVMLMEERDFVLVTDKTSDVKILDKYFSRFKDRLLIEAFTKEDYKALNESGYKPMISLSSSEGLSWRTAAIYFIYHPINDGIVYDRLVTGKVNNYVARMLKRILGVKIAYYATDSKYFFHRYLGREIDMVYTDSLNLNKN